MTRRLTGLAKRIVPGYAVVPLASTVCASMLAYYGTRLIPTGIPCRDLSLPIDRALPFAPAFIVVYVLAYLQWIVVYVLIARDSRELCYRMISASILSKLICLAVFVLLPTSMARPDAIPGGPFGRITALIYRVDPPDNLFPSIHCLESWFCLRGAMQLKHAERGHLYINLVFSPLLFVSTLLVKQHVFVDVVAGILTSELGIQLARRTDAAAIFRRIEARAAAKKSLPGGRS